jgi:DNA polymerase III subunit gamma/tau
MSYLVLARKYRPKNFSEMVGQSHVVQALGNALTTQRLHHAYLFTGTRGVGKTTISRILAKSLNCIGTDGLGGITATPCGVCQACNDIDSGRFVDYTELDAASNRGVDEIAQLLEQAVYKPVVGRFKVFMIDEVHMLTNTAFNAMLKTLEEPPEYLKFVLATTDPQKVPATVLSRCLQFNLRPMAPETILEHLGHVLGIENVPSEPQALRLLARAARGSMRDALSLTDQAIAFGSGALGEASVRLMLGSVDRSYVFKLLDALARGDGKTVVETSEALRLNGLSAASTLEEMTTVLQRMAVLQAVPDMLAKSLETDEDTDPEATETARLAQTLPPDETQLLYSLCLHGRGELGLAPDEYAALTMVLLRLLAFKPAGSAPVPKTGSAAEPGKKPHNVSDSATVASQTTIRHPGSEAPAPGHEPGESMPPAVLAKESESWIADRVRNDSQEKTPENSAFKASNQPKDQSIRAQVAPEMIASKSAQSETPESVSPELGDFWASLVTRLVASDAIKTMARELALQSQLVARDGALWTLRVESPSLNSLANIDKLQSAIHAEQQGVADVQLTVEIGAVLDTPVRRNQALAKQRQVQAEALINNDPFVQDMIRNWGGKVVPGSIKVSAQPI